MSRIRKFMFVALAVASLGSVMATTCHAGQEWGDPPRINWGEKPLCNWGSCR